MQQDSMQENNRTTFKDQALQPCDRLPGVRVYQMTFPCSRFLAEAAYINLACKTWPVGMALFHHHL